MDLAVFGTLSIAAVGRSAGSQPHTLSPFVLILAEGRRGKRGGLPVKSTCWSVVEHNATDVQDPSVPTLVVFHELVTLPRDFP